jgi:hypothetical protein
MLYQGMSEYSNTPSTRNLPKTTRLDTPTAESVRTSEQITSRAITSLQVGEFHRSFSQFQEAIKRSESNWKARLGLGITIYLQHVQQSSSRKLSPEAESAIRKSIEQFNTCTDIQGVESFILRFFNTESLQYGLELLDWLKQTDMFDATILVCNDLQSLNLEQGVYASVIDDLEVTKQQAINGIVYKENSDEELLQMLYNDTL